MRPTLQLLAEIILVDDGSPAPDLGERLQRYVDNLPKVRLFRQPKRLGLVLGRLKGIELANTETVTVLDSHIEVCPPNHPRGASFPRTRCVSLRRGRRWPHD